MEANSNIDIINVNLPDSGILAESRYQRPDFSKTPHAHSHLSLMYVVSGAGICSIDSVEYNLQTDSVILMQKGLSHRLEDQRRNNMTVFSIYFDPNIAGLDSEIIDLLFKDSTPFSAPAYYAGQMRRIIRLLLHEQQTREPGYQIATRQYLTQMTLYLYRMLLKSKSTSITKKDNSELRAKETLDHLSKNYFDPISLPEAAKMAKLSQRQFSNMCKKITGKSFVQFVNITRTEKAGELLTNSQIPVAAVAFEVGFEELSTFYRAFKKYYKASPLEFRRLSQ